MLYRQEFVRCGRRGCFCMVTKGASGKYGLSVRGHGPYWYGYWSDFDRLRKIYVGKKLPKLREHDRVGRPGVALRATMDLGPGPAKLFRRRGYGTGHRPAA
jgi:hypothetical protein